jgi:hypothetical protein
LLEGAEVEAIGVVVAVLEAHFSLRVMLSLKVLL